MSEPLREPGDDVVLCPSLQVRVRDVRYICDESVVVGETEELVAGMLVGRPGAAEPRGDVRVRFAGRRVGEARALANGAFVVDYLIPRELVDAHGDRGLELRASGRPRRVVRLPNRGARFHYRLDEGSLTPPPPISREGFIDMPLDYGGARGGMVRALNARTGAFVEQVDDQAQMRVLIEGLTGDDVIVAVEEPGGTVGGCYATVEGGFGPPWKPSCWCSSDERQRGECEAPSDFPGTARVEVAPEPVDAGVYDPDAAFD